MNWLLLPLTLALAIFLSLLFIIAEWFLFTSFVGELSIQELTFILPLFPFISGSAPCVTPTRTFHPRKEDPGRGRNDPPGRRAVLSPYGLNNWSRGLFPRRSF